MGGGIEVPRNVAMLTIFWLSVGSNFGCMIASATRCLILRVGFWVKLSDEDIAEIRASKVRCHGNQFWD